jgi:hypothetical protein
MKCGSAGLDSSLCHQDGVLKYNTKVTKQAGCRLYRTVIWNGLNTIILPLILYGCETWSLMLREEPGLRQVGSREENVWT